MIKLVSIFLMNLIYISSFNRLLFLRNKEITDKIFINLQSDFIAIYFPYNFSIDNIFISFVISLFVTFLVKIFVLNRLKFDSVFEIINNLTKLFFIYSGSIFSIFYLFRMFNLNRGLIIISIVLYPILSFIVITFLNFSSFNYFKKYKASSIVPISLMLTLIFILFYQSQNNDKSEFSIDATTTTTIPFNELGVVQEDCKPWLGSDNFSGCVSGIELQILDKYQERLTNIVTYKNGVYLLENSGKVYDLKDDSIFIDVSSKVGTPEDFFESGLFSIAFHPSEKYFLISYSDLENNLAVEKYYLNNNLVPNLENSEVILQIPNPMCCHYSGNIIWSNYFNDFLISVGDMETDPYNHSGPLDTTNPKGKILFLNKKESETDLLAVNSSDRPRKDILAFGLRNPWQTYEYKNFLFIPDIGDTKEEELNILDLEGYELSKEPYLLGWPYFEGTIDNEIEFNEILLHKENISKNIKQYIVENSIFPAVYYSHQAPENYRAAIIGGGVIQDKNSKYFESYIFADYFSSELFIYDFKNNQLKIAPLGQLDSYITSVTIIPFKKDTLYITTGSGALLELILP
jgi:hypothetical protein